MSVALNNSRLGRPPKYPGLVKASDALGVSYGHLWAVVAGRKKSISLLKRYAEYQKAVEPGKANI
jgi:hypothetical protein